MFARGITIKVNFLVNSKNIIKVSSLLNKMKSGMVRFTGTAKRWAASFVAGMRRAAAATAAFGRAAWKFLSDTERQMERLRASVDGLVNAFRKSFVILMSLYAIGRGLGSFIAAAGAIEENLNAMSISFERNQDAVLDWADAYGKATGRSRYELRETATQFSLIMKGQISDSATVARLAQGLTERAIDMQSALQEAAGEGADVSRAIISMLTGETEQIKRWGVVVKVDIMKDFAKEQGKNWNKMSEGERIELRYQKLLSDTNYLIGDAIRTKREYTNTIKNLWGVLEDFRRMIGMGILKPVLKLTNAFVDNIRKLNEWLEVGSRVQAMFGTIGVVLAAALAKAAVLFAPLMLKFAILSVAVTVVWAILEDFLAWLNEENRETAFGKFADDVGLTTTQVRELADAMWDLGIAMVLVVGTLAKYFIMTGKFIGEGVAKSVLRDRADETQIGLHDKYRRRYTRLNRTGVFKPGEQEYLRRRIRETSGGKMGLSTASTEAIINHVDVQVTVEDTEAAARDAAWEVYKEIRTKTGYLWSGPGAEGGQNIPFPPELAEEG